MAKPKTAKSGSFWHKRHQKYTSGRLRKDIITFEEALWLIVGLVFGWFVGKGMSLFFLIIPAVLFLVWVYEFYYAKNYGIRTIHGELRRSK
jgi:hypothetical protein